MDQLSIIEHHGRTVRPRATSAGEYNGERSVVAQGLLALMIFFILSASFYTHTVRVAR